MHRRVVNGFVLAEKIQALKEIVEYDRRNSVAINLENLSETAEDFEPVLNEVPIHDNRGGQSLVNVKIMRKTFHSRGDYRSRTT